MKDINDNKTVDWVSAERSQAAIFERMLSVLQIVKKTPVVSTIEISEAMSISRRTAQRYMYGLEHAGYIRRKRVGGCNLDRLFLTEKAQQLFGDNA